MQQLKISENKRCFVREDGEPFIWLADTAWTMPQRMKWDDVDYYMQMRKRQGFTVLQIVALDPERDVDMRSPSGEKALLHDDLAQLNEAYFKYLDFIVDKAESYGFYLLLLPVWGQLVVGDNWMGGVFPKTVTQENAYEYARFIGNRYRERKHIIWCLGGDRMPRHRGIDYRMVWRRMAEGLAMGVLGKSLAYNQDRESWSQLPLTYHACHEAETGECSTMSYWTDDEAWIQFIMIQSGHGLAPKNYELIEKEYTRAITMPVWDGEPAYEMMPTSWPVIDGFHGSWIVRKRAYWSLFAGSFGHTYGHASVWCSISEKERDTFTRYTWVEALEQEGASQIKYLRDFLEAVDLSSCRPSQELLLMQSAQEEMDQNDHKQACVNAANVLSVYFPKSGTETIDMQIFAASQSLHVSWFNPRDGKCYDTHAVPMNALHDNKLHVKTPTEGEEDWILLISDSEEKIAIPNKRYGEDMEVKEARKVFDW